MIKKRTFSKRQTHMVALNFADLCDAFEGHVPPTDNWSMASNKHYDSEFHGTKEFGADFDSAKRLMTIGYQPEEMKSVIASFESAFEASIDVIQLAEEGHDFDVASVLSEEPESWFSRRTRGGLPSVHIVYNGSAPAYCEPENFYRQGAVVCKLAEMLEDEMHVKVSASYCSKRSLRGIGKDKDCAILISVKDYDEPSDLRRIGGVTHPAFLRRITFAIKENEGGKFFDKRLTNTFDYGISAKAPNIGVTDDVLNEEFKSDVTISVARPHDNVFNTDESAVEYLNSLLKELEL